MRRRDFVALVAGAALCSPPDLRAQPASRLRRIAVLMGASPSKLGETHLATFLQRLEQLGWSKDQTALIEIRWWTGGPESMRPVISELLAFSPEVIMVFSNLALAVLKPMAGSVPIVFVGVGDPVGEGFVDSFAHPGGNITGFSGTLGPIGSKWLEVLKETAPHATRVMALMHTETPVHQAFWRSIEEAAPRLGVEAIPGAVHDAAEIDAALASLARGQSAGVIVCPHAVTWANEDLIIAQTLRHRLPAIFPTTVSVLAGGLVSYGHDFDDSFRKTADYVDRILRGARPADLPVQQPTKFTLAVNLKTARAIGLTIPPDVLTLADQVVE
jgi:putative ABC transport system substrate-binding protein